METFVWTACQSGAERLLKQEVASRWPELRLAFSRTGLLSFKRPDAGGELSPAVFGRQWIHSLGQLRGDNGAALAEEFLRLPLPPAARHLHVWQQEPAGDPSGPQWRTPLAAAVGELLQRTWADRGGEPWSLNRRARPGDVVVDCCLAEPGQWWVGWHRAESVESCWPGAVYEYPLPDDALSRAYQKTAEAIAWSRFPLSTGETVVELGSAPGGSSQFLLERGLVVAGVDPAEMDASLSAHPNFLHIRRRVSEVKRREFRAFRWLTADLNVAPRTTLDAVAEIVAYPGVRLRGCLLTLKLLDPEPMAAAIPDYLAEIRGWGFHFVRARQLSHNRQEFCVAAARRKHLVRLGQKKRRRGRGESAPTAEKE